MRKRTELTPAQVEYVHEKLWRRGDLSVVCGLHRGQLELRNFFYGHDARVTAYLISRRWGKSYLWAVIANELAMKGKTVLYAAPEIKHVRSILREHMAKIHGTLPKPMRDEIAFSGQDNEWRFKKTGGIIRAIGVDKGGADRGRGIGADLVICDEAGFMEDLEYFLESVARPQTLTTNGRIVLSSTPGISSEHAFRGYCLRAQEDDAYVHKTIYDAPHLTPKTIEEYKQECLRRGGQTEWRREYMAEWVVDEFWAVVPEMIDHGDDIIAECQRPSHYDTYTAGDVAFEDLTVFVHGHLDFVHQVIVVEDETVLRHSNAGQIAAKVLQSEYELWGDKPVFSRVADAPPLVLGALGSAGLRVGPTRNDDRDAMLVTLRVLISQHKIRIHPRCRTTIAHLRGAVWNKSRTNLERTSAAGHFDAVMAMAYLVRNMNWRRNPFPGPEAGIDPHHSWLRNDDGPPRVDATRLRDSIYGASGRQVRKLTRRGFLRRR